MLSLGYRYVYAIVMSIAGFALCLRVSENSAWESKILFYLMRSCINYKYFPSNRSRRWLTESLIKCSCPARKVDRMTIAQTGRNEKGRNLHQWVLSAASVILIISLFNVAYLIDNDNFKEHYDISFVSLEGRHEPRQWLAVTPNADRLILSLQITAFSCFCNVESIAAIVIFREWFHWKPRRDFDHELQIQISKVKLFFWWFRIAMI